MLRQLFENHRGRLVEKWRHYPEIYERHFARFRGGEVTLLEIGVGHGGSLQVWKEYFGPKAAIWGVDVAERCKAWEEERVRILIGDQGDRDFLASIRRKVPRIDILIDDGSHRMDHQIATFEELFDHVHDDGVYVVEDLHTSYWDRYGGGLRRVGTFVEYAKRLVDQLNAFHTEDAEAFEVDDFTLAAHSMHFYDSMLVIEKRPRQQPARLRSGAPSFPHS